MPLDDCCVHLDGHADAGWLVCQAAVMQHGARLPVVLAVMVCGEWRHTVREGKGHGEQQLIVQIAGVPDGGAAAAAVAAGVGGLLPAAAAELVGHCVRRMRQYD